jgi:hypothetical protein
MKETPLPLTYDRNFRGEEDQHTIKELEQALKFEVDEEFKKSLLPIAIITIGGLFILKEIASGFFKKMGADGYDKFKELLGKLLGQLKEGEKEKLFTFNTTVVDGSSSVNVEVIITNPTPELLQDFIENGLKALDGVLPHHFNSKPGFARIVFEYDVTGLHVKFGVLRNGRPVALR